jgi:hypothetical protein
MCLVALSFVVSAVSVGVSSDSTGSTLTVSQGIDTAYSAILTQLKKDGYSIDSASKDAGIKTSLVVAGGYHQTGTHTEISFISESADKTDVRVAVMQQKRYKALSTDPWSDPKASAKDSEALAAKLKQELGW